MPTPLETLLNKQRIAADKADDFAVQRLVTNYQSMAKRLKPRIDALEQYLLRLKLEENYSVQTVEKSPIFNNLMDEIDAELSDYSSYLAAEIRSDTGRAVLAGILSGATLLQFLFGEIEPNQPNSDDVALQVLSSYLENGSPLMNKIRGMNGNAEAIRDMILEGVTVGRNPLTIARMIVEDVLGVGLSDAMRWTRTAQLYSYRWGTLSDYEANSDVVKGWIWQANLDADTCMSCISLHGKVFGLEEGVANDHYNGRCFMIPYIPGATDQFANPNAGKEFFDELPTQSQEALMGKGKYEAFQAGKFEFDQLSTFYESDTFGLMRYETPLKDLVQSE